MKIRAVALNTFKEAIRDRILYLLLFFAAVSLILSRLLSLLTVGDKIKIIMDVGLSSISIFGVLMAILMGTGLVYKEIDKKTVYTLLSKPINRNQFILGKFLGLIITLFIMLVVMTAIFIIIILLHSGTIHWKLFVSLGFVFLELCLVTSVALLFSCFSTPILSSIFSLSFYLIGHLSWGLETLIKKMSPGITKILTQAAYTLLPDLENFNFKTEVVHSLSIQPEMFLFSFFYGITYTFFILMLAMVVFRKRDFI
jgi:ABC-type transport system involved in multi-copper enzyme maturation permease subunit